MLNIINDYVNNDDQFTRKTAVPQRKFLDLVNLVLTTTWYAFNSQLYQQTDGVAMGGLASSTTAEIYMLTKLLQYLRHYTLQKFKNNLLMKLTLFLNVHTWKTFSITSTIFIKMLSLLWRRK